MKIKLFGVLKTMIPGGRDLEMELSEERRVKDLVYSIQVAYPQVGELLEQKKVLVSVNQEIAHWDTVLEESDEVALLPPFAGGSDEAHGWMGGR
ncbi:MAG: MoaD/ThiS family protein [Nitrospira sp.]|nr:MoaD/ThiS family protein [Nitrospira sp.]MCA9476078.1 MoaD/ThiS family protein [Nitrospira sp.]MCA9481579.1 MoaD/ThiS family protein [Nitrospira sp.]MCB9711449.1 MoaD/ThiS family protein [Nitrospiraceae bacterium]